MIEAVELVTGDGITLRGELRPGGSDWAVLAHDQGEDIDAWRPLARHLADLGLTVLAVDLRGHGGSDGVPDPDGTGADMAAMIALARAGEARRIFLGAAGRSSAAALATAAAEGGDAVFLLGPVGGELRAAALPRLSVASSLDPEQQLAARSLHRSPGWSVVANVPEGRSGCGFLSGRWGSNVIDYVSSFLTDRQRGGQH